MFWFCSSGPFLFVFLVHVYFKKCFPCPLWIFLEESFLINNNSVRDILRNFDLFLRACFFDFKQFRQVTCCPDKSSPPIQKRSDSSDKWFVSLLTCTKLCLCLEIIICNPEDECKRKWCGMISYYGNPINFRVALHINQSWQAPLLLFYLCNNRCCKPPEWFIVNYAR